MSEYSFYGRSIPDNMMAGIRRYIERRIIPGDFLQSIICNDLGKACGYADEDNLWIIPVYVNYFYNHAPTSCWGSKQKMIAWLGKCSK